MRLKFMRNGIQKQNYTLKTCFYLAIISALILVAVFKILSYDDTDDSTMCVYQVGKKVCDFDDEVDLSKPEFAYVYMNRLKAEGKSIRSVSVAKIRKNMPLYTKKHKAQEETYISGLLNSKILEVRISDNEVAAVIAQCPHNTKTVIDVRYFGFENGKWLNYGNDVFGNMKRARKKFVSIAAYYSKAKIRPEVMDDEEQYLKPYVDFLNLNAEQPHEYVMNILRTYPLVVDLTPFYVPTLIRGLSALSVVYCWS